LAVICLKFGFSGGLIIKESIMKTEEKPTLKIVIKGEWFDQIIAKEKKQSTEKYIHFGQVDCAIRTAKKEPII
jgi:hypothetical protein